jgi:hypothetical protein
LLDHLWRILILGWPVLVATTEETFEVLNLVITMSFSEIYHKPSRVTVPKPSVVMDPITGKITEERKVVRSNPVYYYKKLLVD